MTGLERIRIAGLAAVAGAAVIWAIAQDPANDASRNPVGSGTGANVDLAQVVASLDRSAEGALSGPWTLSLPGDFGSHPAAPSETWSISAHVEDPEGRSMAFTFLLSRLGPARDTDAAEGPWGPGPYHVGQAIVTSEEPGFRDTASRASRSVGTAGHDADLGEVWIDDWTMSYGENGLDLALRVSDRPLQLSLEPLKAALQLSGEETPGTRGFVIPRLAVTGTLGTGADALRLSGTAWLDRLWGDVPLPGGPLVRDRLVLHLSDGTDLSLLRTRRRDGRGIATLDGVIVAPDGKTTIIDDAVLDVTPETEDGDRGMPTAWRISGTGLDLRASVLDASLSEGIGLSTWVGQLTVEGEWQGRDVGGTGTILFSPDNTS